MLRISEWVDDEVKKALAEETGVTVPEMAFGDTDLVL
jgi:hypothetical protein